MHATEILEHARKLFDVRGNKAIADAAQKAVELQRNGRPDAAKDWRRIEAALRQMQGPHES
ncbi:MAG: hypothetical protein GC150_15455 [Rhizobiales bacterium]|nr:hypothetical protein [Hyphomicrobiales bacterium]